ncbi:MAG: leucine-rich repeat domain-containing protein, partial [Clostridia bacterium]|nr:leucine-rich repeat domain-containing protein [Clostridia bacterium]
MKKIKMFVIICISFLLAALAAVGVFAAKPITYTLEGTLEYEMSDAIVKITTTVYRSSVAQTSSEIEKTVNTISTNNTIPAELSVVSSGTLKQSGISKNFLDNFTLSVDDSSVTYYMVVNINNQVPSKNVWAWVDENTVFPNGASYYSNNIQQNITTTAKSIVYAINVSGGIDTTTPFQTKIKLGTGVLANQPFNTKKLTIAGTSVTPVNKDIAGTVIVPSGITTIPDQAFKDCVNLENIILPTSLRTIGEAAFSGCSNLKSIEIPEGVTTIKEETFRNCSSLTKIKIPTSLSSIEYYYTFDGCTSLNEVHISDFVSWSRISYQYNYYDKGPLYYAGNLYINGELLTHLVIPTSLTSLSAGAISYCKSLQEVTFHSNITSVYSDAFLGCTNLSKVNIASELSWLNISFADYDANPLYYAHNLYKNGNLITEFTVPSSKTIVNDYQFAGASCLTSVVFQGTSCTIDKYAFYKCTGLSSIILPSSSRLYNMAF